MLSDLSLPADLPPCRALVVFAPVASVMTALGDAERWLSAAEREGIAACCCRFERRRRLAAHGLKRLLLGRLCGRDPARFRFTRDPSGRPRLAGHDGIDVNLSHSGGWLAVAIARHGRVGVDVEQDRTTLDWDGLEPHFLHARERAMTAGLPPAARRRFCLERWCLKEALLKATGEGLVARPQTLLPRPSGRGWRLERGGHALTAAVQPLAEDVFGAWALTAGFTVTLAVMH